MIRTFKASIFVAATAAAALLAAEPLQAVTAVVQPHSIVLDQATQTGSLVESVRRFGGGGRGFSRGGMRGGGAYWRRGGINRGWRGGVGRRWGGVRPGWGRPGWGRPGWGRPGWGVGWRRGWGRRGWGYGGYWGGGYWGGACGYGWRWSVRWGRCVPIAY